MLAGQVPAYLGMKKTLLGIPKWVPGNRPDQHSLKWPIQCAGIGEGPKIEVDYSASAPMLLYSISLNIPPPIVRLDIGEELDHVVKAGKMTRPKIVHGHHFHAWSRNSPSRGIESLPRELKYCEKYDGPTDFGRAFVWFCAAVGIDVNPSEIPALPTRSTLL